MPLIAYDRAGAVFAVLHELVWTDPQGASHLVDLEAAEAARMPLSDLWYVSGASGSAYWPEHLGDRFLEYRVVRADGRAVRLVHRRTGVARLRSAIDDALAAIEKTKLGAPAKRAARYRLLGTPQHTLGAPEVERHAEVAPPLVHVTEERTPEPVPPARGTRRRARAPRPRRVASSG